MKKAFDINCDMGEVRESWLSGRDKLLLNHISSVNISCGKHAGDEDLIRETIKSSLALDIHIGAHPGYADKENFGRKEQNLSRRELKELIEEQILYLKNLTEAEGGRLHHVKLHGALYHKAAEDKRTSEVVCEMVKEIDGNLILFCPEKSTMAKVAEEQELEVWFEAFADRVYQMDGSLRPRTLPDSMITDPEKAWKQTEDILQRGVVMTHEKTFVEISADTICIHGDAENALEIAEKLYGKRKG